MQKKHNAIYSDPTGAAAAASPVRHRTARTKASETKTPKGSSSDPAGIATPEPAVDREAVARLAYSYWAARGFTGGSSEEDWLRAEQELREGIATRADA